MQSSPRRKTVDVLLSKLKNFNLPKTQLLYTTTTAVIEYILTSSTTIWCAAITAKDRIRLQRTIPFIERMIGCDACLPWVKRERLWTPPLKTSKTFLSSRSLYFIRTKPSRHNSSFFSVPCTHYSNTKSPHLTQQVILTGLFSPYIENSLNCEHLHISFWKNLFFFTYFRYFLM